MADVKISAITESTTAPADTDVFATVESMGGTPATKRKAWSVLKTAVGGVDGWIPVAGSWAYATATTITVPSGAASIYSIGDKLRFKQGAGYKYYYVVAIADTVLTVTGGSDYTVANSALTDIYYSKASSPVGFPQYFLYTPTGVSASNITLTGKFTLTGRLCHTRISAALTGAITFTTMPTLPITASASLLAGFANLAGVGGYYDASPTAFVYNGLYPVVLASGTTVSLHKADSVTLSATVPITWANGDYFEAYFSYEI